jgi:uncharacterized membrane protein
MSDRQLAIVLFIVAAVLFAIGAAKPLLFVVAVGVLLAGFILIFRGKRRANRIQGPR